MGCPHLWLHKFLGVTVRLFLGETNIRVSRLNTADLPPHCEWASYNSLETWIEGESWAGENLPSQPVFSLGLLSSLNFGLGLGISSLRLQVMGLLSFRNNVTQFQTNRQINSVIHSLFLLVLFPEEPRLLHFASFLLSYSQFFTLQPEWDF